MNMPQVSTAGLQCLLVSLQKFQADEQARQLAEQRLREAFGEQVVVTADDVMAFRTQAAGEQARETAPNSAA